MADTSRYHISRVIGRGGMAEVLEAHVRGQEGFERRVAIKRLLPDLRGQDSVLRGFVDEARIASHLHHANVVGVSDFGVMDGRPFLVMDFVDGANLLELEREASRLGVKLSVEIALHIVSEVARGLDYAHNARDGRGRSLGIVHRDVSPQNILVSWSGEVKLTDFGIAYAFDRLEATRVGIAKGKLGYMAPEQVKDGEVDHRADIFALGCVLHRLISGRSPMDDTEGRNAVIAGGPTVIDRAIPDDVRSLIERATRGAPRQRYESIGELANACWEIVQKRTNRDGRVLLREWMQRLQPGHTAMKRSPLEEMMNLDLVLKEDTGLRRFESVAGQAGSNLQPETLLTTVHPQDFEESGPSTVDTAPNAHTRPETQRTSASASISSEGSTGPIRNHDQRREQSSADPLVGRVVHSYRILELIGRGASARVYRAVHTVLEREHAIKVLYGKSAGDDRAITRLKREAQVLSKIGHPNVVSVDDFGYTPDGQPFLAMEYLRGRTLKERIKGGELFEPREAATTIRQICAGLTAAHRQSVIHRDLKPGNIVLLPTQGGEWVKLLDFGIARATLGNSDMTRLTRSDQLLGTPSYMAPEQIKGARDVQAPADLYSLGAILYAMLTGRAPFLGSPIEVIHQHLSAAPPPLAPAGGLERLALALLEKDPTRRLQTAEQVDLELTRLGFAASRLKEPEPEAPQTRVTVFEDVPDHTRLVPPAVAPTQVNPGTVTHVPPTMRTASVDQGAIQAGARLPRWAIGLGVGSMVLAIGSLAALTYVLNERPAQPAAVVDQPSKPTPILATGAGEPQARPPDDGPKVVPPKAPPKPKAPEPKPPKKAPPSRKVAQKRIERTEKAKAPRPEEPAVGAQIDQSELTDRMRRLSKRMKKLSPVALGDLEDRYLEVREGFRKGQMTQAELRKLAKKLAALERDAKQAAP